MLRLVYAAVDERGNHFGSEELDEVLVFRQGLAWLFQKLVYDLQKVLLELDVVQIAPVKLAISKLRNNISLTNWC